MSTSVTSVVSHFPSAEAGFTTTLASTISSGAATVPLNSVSGYANGEIVVFIVDPDNDTKKQAFTGTIDTAGVQVTSVVWTSGTNQSHTAGATVVDYPSATHVSMITKGLLRDHNQSGYHKTLNDDNGNEWIKQSSTASAVNELTVANAATGTSPSISATGNDSNIGITLTPKGTGNVGFTLRHDGWTTGLPTPNTVTYNGGRNYSLVFNTTDLTGYISNGQRLKLTRTVTAPTQCTSLNGTTQYYSKTSPAGMTFTDDFVVSAWVKLSSYGNYSIASRYNGTSGWDFGINNTGQVQLIGINAGASNLRLVNSYASIPLNKWVHVAAQLDMSAFTATTVTCYVMIDGLDSPAQVQQAGTNPTALIQAGNLEIGSRNGGSQFFGGKLAQVAIFNAKVTQATMQGYISQGLAGTETSLISAYSFSNSKNDLNANANNLTANGSAVETTVDSPFAGGTNAATAYTAGTAEFGEVFNVSFSTNTTMVVQVPDGYAVPTSGGVSAVAYSTQSTPLGWPLNGGITALAYVPLCGVITMTTPATSTAISGLTVSPYIPNGRWVKVTVNAGAGFRNSAGTVATNLAICKTSASDATRIQQSNVTGAVMSATVTNYISAQVIDSSNTGGTQTYIAAVNTASGNVLVDGAAVAPGFILVELI